MNLEVGKSAADTVAIVAKYILANPEVQNNPTKMIEGWGFDQASWPSGTMPVAVSVSPMLLLQPSLIASSTG
jgi:hypothetical protein